MVVGSIELLPVDDAVGILGALDELYPGTPSELWESHRSSYPELYAGDSWRLPCKCYLLRADGRTVLVDTGVGPPGLWSWQPEREGGLLPTLAEHGVAPEDVDTVLNTHIHVDHVGWNTDADGRAVFPQARYLLHADALAAARDRADQTHIQRCLLAIDDRLETIVDGDELLPGASVVELPGHAAGHVGVRLGAEAIVLVDALPHPALLDRPESVFKYDLDAERAVATRRALLAELVDRPLLAVCGHYPGSGIGRVVSREGRVVWEAA